MLILSYINNLRETNIADERLFFEQACSYDVIHIVEHGVIESDNPLSSYLLLMESFHKFVVAGDHPPVALAKKQSDLRNNPDKNWRAANFRAGFVYIAV